MGDLEGRGIAQSQGQEGMTTALVRQGRSKKWRGY